MPVTDLEAWFSLVTSLETVVLDGRAYVLAGGADDGITLFELLPGGRLLKLDTVADTAETGLSNVVALAAHGSGGVPQVFAGSERETGVTQFSVGFGAPDTVQIAGPGGGVLTGGAGEDLLVWGAGDDRIEGGIGADTLEGGEGNDRLAGGLGDDVLTGGIGADVFVFNAGIDVITDFSLNVDRVELLGGALGLVGLDGAAVVDRFGDITPEGAVLAFAPDTRLDVDGVFDLTRLADLIEII